jgi:formylglycine-generating enzyme required for sulfatase activity
LIVDLTPGTYYLLSSTEAPHAPADVTLRWGRNDAWDTVIPIMPPPSGPLTVEPRLMRDGLDETPAFEPHPGIAIDRLLDVDVAYGERRTARVLLAGECTGTQADLAGGASCVDTAGARSPVSPVALRAGIDRSTSSSVGQWGAPHPCATPAQTGTTLPNGAPAFDEEICVPGGAFVYGELDLGALPVFHPTPEQVTLLEPFFIDRYEMTVGRLRAALAAGFQFSPDVVDESYTNDGPATPSQFPDTNCTFNGDASGPAPGIDRESYPVNCLSWYAARQLCQFLGKDLPSAAEWEYAALQAGGDGKKRSYPWGEAAPSCDQLDWGHRPGGPCSSAGIGLVPVDTAPWAQNDVTPLGIIGMGGSQLEWVLDSFRAYDDACWWQRPLHGVGCMETEAPNRILRGLPWGAVVAYRTAVPEHYSGGQYTDDAGFRCVRREKSLPGFSP